MPEYVLYNAPQSTCSQRVRYVLHAKGREFEEHKLDLFKGDQLKPEYLAINPNGVVPALVHDGKPVIDSAVIMEYLEDILADVAPLRPRDPLEVARMRAMMRFIDEVPTPAVRVPSYNLAFLPHYQAMTEEEFLARLRKQAVAPGVPAEDGPHRLSPVGDGRGDRPSEARDRPNGTLAARERRTVADGRRADARRHRHHAGDRADGRHQSRPPVGRRARDRLLAGQHPGDRRLSPRPTTTAPC